MIKTTYKEILEATKALSKLLDVQLRPAQAIALARLCKKLNEELELFRKEQEKMKGHDLQKKLQELLAVEVQLDTDKVKLTVDKIDAGTILAAETFVEIEEEPA